MPAGFDKCEEGGGKIRTISGPNKKYGLSSDQYVHICIKDGNVHKGHKKTKQTKKELQRT